MTDRGGEIGGGRARPVSRLAQLGFGIALLSMVVLIAAAFGYRLELWSYRFALSTLTEFATYGALAATVISLIGMGHSMPGSGYRGFLMSLVGVIIGGYSFHAIYDQWITVKTVPFIHDITTDTENPPPFIAVVPIRQAEKANPHEYEGAELAFQQRCGYPDLGPYMAADDPGAVFDTALKVAESMDWNIVDANRAQGRIEATDTTVWYHFEDDIVIRIGPGEGGSGARVDMRSLSRSGRSDVGVNAARIKDYLAALDDALS